AVLEQYGAAFARLQRIQSALQALDRDAREREREKDLLEYQIREIEAVRPTTGEIRSLAEEESRLSHADRILALAAAAEETLGEEAGGADRLREAAATAQAIATLDPGIEDLE